MHGAIPPLHPYAFMVCTGRTSLLGHAMVWVVSRWPLTAETCVWSQASQCRIYGGQIGNGTGFSVNTLVFSCHYFISAPYSFIHL
jgi:hypothetical protein